MFDLDEVDGQLFIAMEFVDGKPLSSFVRPDRPLAEKKAAVIVRRLAMALGHAHEHGVVHRDLPSHDDRGGRLRCCSRTVAGQLSEAAAEVNSSRLRGPGNWNMAAGAEYAGGDCRAAWCQSDV